MRFSVFFLTIFLSVDVLSTPSGLPIPRFVSLRSSEVNLRVGPGNHFPTDWVYQRANLPIEIIAEFGDWRKVKDFDGTQGWIHKSLLSGHLYGLVLKDKTPLLGDNDKNSSVVAWLQNGVVAKLLKCKGDFCQIQIRREDSFKGWVLKTDLWGVDIKE